MELNEGEHRSGSQFLLHLKHRNGLFQLNYSTEAGYLRDEQNSKNTKTFMSSSL